MLGRGWLHACGAIHGPRSLCSECPARAENTATPRQDAANEHQRADARKGKADTKSAFSVKQEATGPAARLPPSPPARSAKPLDTCDSKRDHVFWAIKNFFLASQKSTLV